jgi:hypothetical protein
MDGAHSIQRGNEKSIQTFIRISKGKRHFRDVVIMGGKYLNESSRNWV